jgi:hypothetical protein
MIDQAPPRVELDGIFPFGMVNGPRPVRLPESGHCQQIVIGTYPSALHVSWRIPDYLIQTMPVSATGRVASLAVDVEPTVFWDGVDADHLVEQWKRAVGFVDGDAPGSHGRLSPATNGPSGVGLMDDYFGALPFRLEDTAFVDVYPVYFVKRGSAARRGQADAIEQEYDAVVDLLPGAEGSHPRFVRASLPLRPTPAQLPALAAERFGGWLTDVIAALTPQRIVTLGEEAWQTMGYAGFLHKPVSQSLAHSRHHDYGATGYLKVAGRVIEWTALAHPGAVRQSAKKPGGWGQVHARWFAEHATR